MRQAYRRSVAAAAAAAVVSAAAVVGQAGKDDESNDYPDKALVVLKKVAKAVTAPDLKRPAFFGTDFVDWFCFDESAVSLLVSVIYVPISL